MKTPKLPENEAERLQALESYGVLDSAPMAQFDELVKIASTVCDTPIALVSLVDSTRQWFLAREGLDATETHRDLSFCGHAVEAGETLVVPDATQDPRFEDNPLVTGDPNVVFYAGVPLVDSDGFALGTFCVIDRETRTLTSEQMVVLAALARQTVRLIEDTRRQRELAAAHTARLQMELQTQRFFEMGHDLMVIVGLDGTFKRVSTSWERVLGYTDDFLRGRGVLDFVHEDDVAPTAQELGKLASGAAVSGHRVRHRHRDGRFVCLEWSACSDLEASLIYGVARDVTAQEHLERTKAEFVAMVSHELRTPLSSIRGGLGLATGGVLGPVSDAVQEVLEVANKNATRLGRILNDLLDVERLDSLKMDYRFESIDLREVAAESANASRPLGQQQGVRIRVCTPSSPCMAGADGDRMRQVLDNLLSNALKYSERGCAVDLVLLETEHGWRFEVQDGGPGVPPEFREQLFKRFSQAESSDHRGGSGLGLYISKAIVEGHGGQMGYLARDKGSTFWCELPATPPE